MKEIWKDVIGYEGIYEVSNLGRVKSITRVVKHKNGVTTTYQGKILKEGVDKYGYSRVYLSKNSKQQTLVIHRLVAQAFIPNIENKPQVNHINSVKTDNKISNLEWCTAKENVHHSFKVDSRNILKGENSGCSKLKRWQVLFIIDSCHTQFSSKELGVMFGLDRSEAGVIYKGKSWPHMNKFRLENGVTPFVRKRGKIDK